MLSRRLAIALRLEAGTDIGFGHLVRSMAVVEALSVRLAVEPFIVTRSSLTGVPLPVVHIPATATPEEEAVLLRGLEVPPDIVVADLVQVTEATLRSLRDGPWAFICIDDESTHEFDCDLLINPNLDPGFFHRRTPNTTYFRGADAVLLRSRFRGAPPHRMSSEVSHLVLCFGGSDPVNMTQRSVDWLVPSLRPETSRASVVIGPGYRFEGTLRTTPTDERWRLYREVPDMAGYMQSADLGILAAGTLLYEAAAVGLPAIFVSLNETQAREAAFLHQEGACIHLGVWNTVTQESFGRAVARMAEPRVRSEISSAAQNLVDGAGSARVAEHIVSLLERRGGLS